MPDIAAVTAQIKSGKNPLVVPESASARRKFGWTTCCSTESATGALKNNIRVREPCIHPFDEWGRRSSIRRDWWQAFSQVNGESQFSNGLTAQQRAPCQLKLWTISTSSLRT